MMIPTPNWSNCGLPALPSICITSSWLSSSHLARVGLYTSVPLITTVWAGRFTPHARVAVETKTWRCPSEKRSSTRVLSDLLRPAWWTPMP